MSAIIGVFQKNANVEKSVLYSMQHLLSHRGQYNSTQYIFNFTNTTNCLWTHGGIACNTNKIISNGSLIPLWNDTHDVVIMLDGEIYNADELYDELKTIGVVCRNKTSEEVVLKLFLLYGIDETLKLLDGAFSIAIYDKRVEKFYLVRFIEDHKLFQSNEFWEFYFSDSIFQEIEKQNKSEQPEHETKEENNKRFKI